jgi:hypothetical protein
MIRHLIEDALELIGIACFVCFVFFIALAI